MEPIFKELTKLESLSVPSSSSSSSSSFNKKSKTSSSSSTSAPALSVTLDGLISSLVKAQAKASSASISQEELQSIWAGLEKEIGGSKEKIDEAIKTWHKAIGRVASAVEKALPPPIPIASPLYFTSPEATAALDRAVISALVRMGETGTVEALSRNSPTTDNGSTTPLPEAEIAKAQMLHSIINSMKAGDLQPALQWINQHGSHLLPDRTSTSPPSPLPFYIHRSIFVNLLLSPFQPSSSRTSSIPPPILYAQTHFPPFTPHHLSTISRLLTATLYLPATKLASSPYADLLDENLHQKLLIPLFEREFCAWAGWPEKEVLGVAVGVGANGAVARIEKGRKVMKERVGEGWKMGGELPMEIPLPPSLRFHSIFACPVSKILATPSNPPMMLVCGHAVAKESFAKLGKGIRTVKCPYCPVETPVASALELHF